MLPLTTRWPGNSWNKRLWNLLCANFQGHVIKESAGLGSKPATRLGSVLYCSLSVNFFPHRKKFHSTHSRNTSKLKRFSSCPSKKFFSATFGKKYILGKKRKEQTSVYYLVTIRLSPGLGGEKRRRGNKTNAKTHSLSHLHTGRGRMPPKVSLKPSAPKNTNWASIEDLPEQAPVLRRQTGFPQASADPDD